MTDVTISILTHNLGPHTVRCLKAVMDSCGDAVLILTANGSSEAADLFRSIAEDNKNVTVMDNPVNQGFIHPNCIAFSLCKTAYFCLLNDDAIPAPEWLDKMKQAFVDDPKCAVSGPNGRHLDNDFIGRRLGLMDYIEGSCMMVRSEFMSRPLFSPELQWAYCEDADLCLRMREKGYTIKQVDFELDHRPGTTTRTVPQLHNAMRKNFEVCRKRWAYYLKHRTFET